MRVLKIKNSIDLKELERFGFHYRDDYKWDLKYTYIDSNYEIIISQESREITFNVFFLDDCCEEEIDIIVIYDLIKADMVEVVEVEG